MAEPEWGQKRVCPSCSARFYDLTNNPTTCPSCGAEFPLEALSERKSTASRAKPKAAEKAAPAKAAAAAAGPDADEEDDDLIDSADEEEEIEGDDDVLLDDDEDEDDDLGEIGDVAPAKTDGDEES